MTFDFMAVVSYGAYPTPTPTNARRAALAVSMGLLNLTLAEEIITTVNRGLSMFGFSMTMN